MKSSSRLILISMLVLSSFLMGFTYRDLGTGSGFHGLLASIDLVPSRLSSVITTAVTAKDAELPPVETYWSVASYLDAHYYGEKPQPKQLTYAAIRGMLASLGDRYTRFLDPVEHTELQDENRGDFEGIGAELDTKEGRIYIRRPIPKSPAIRAGLQAGDVILKVNDELIQGLDITDVVKKIRGQRGTKVKLTITREDKPQPFDVEIERDVIPFMIVEARMEDSVDKIGYIALRQFNEKSDQQLYEAMNQLDSEGARALILDLRQNPGGLLDSAISIGSRFINNGNIVIVQQKGGRRNALAVDRSKHNHAMRPLVVLVDHGTASSSEIVAGAIQDHKTGTIIGQDSFGKGLIQTIITLQDGEAVVITTARYLTPAGHDVAKQKIHPDIVVEPSDDDIKNDNDVQLKKAVSYLKDTLTKQANSELKGNEKG